MKIRFPEATIKSMADKGLRESDIIDVINHGESINKIDGTKMIVKKYENYGYEIGIFYVSDNSYDYVVTAVWKRPRR